MLKVNLNSVTSLIIKHIDPGYKCHILHLHLLTSSVFFLFFLDSFVLYDLLTPHNSFHKVGVWKSSAHHRSKRHMTLLIVSFLMTFQRWFDCGIEIRLWMCSHQALLSAGVDYCSLFDLEEMVVATAGCRCATEPRAAAPFCLFVDARAMCHGVLTLVKHVCVYLSG